MRTLLATTRDTGVLPLPPSGTFGGDDVANTAPTEKQIVFRAKIGQNAQIN
jgi:hypothetical protein